MAEEQGRLRVLVVTHSVSGGGAERFAVNLAAGLDRGRFAPSLCSVIDRVTYPVPGDVAVTTLGYRGLHHLPRTLLALRRRIAAESPDLVLSNVLSTNCLAGGALAGLSPRPAWVARVGNAPGIADPPLQRLWARAVYPRAQALVCNSRGMVEAFRRRYPRAAQRVTSLPNPTDFAALDRLAAAEPAVEPGGGALALLAVGRLTRQKRPDLLLDVLVRVRERVDARLWVCGEGPLRRDLEARIVELGLGGSVALLGFCENPFALMRRAALFLLASDFEGLPNALIEAQGLGLPAVTTRCPYGPDEIVDEGVSGRLVPAGDAEAMARAVLELAADQEGRRRMGEAARQRTRERFGAARVLPAWEALLAGAAGREA